MEDPILPEIQPHRLFWIGDVGFPSALKFIIQRAFASGRISCNDLFTSARITWSRVNLLYCVNLCRRQALVILFRFAQKNSWIKVASLRLRDDAVLDAVQSIARRNCCLID